MCLVTYYDFVFFEPCFVLLVDALPRCDGDLVVGFFFLAGVDFVDSVGPFAPFGISGMVFDPTAPTVTSIVGGALSVLFSTFMFGNVYFH
jgi:hypothetical protein